MSELKGFGGRPSKKKEVPLEEKTVRGELAAAMDSTRTSIALLDVMALFKSKNTTVTHIAAAVGFDPGIAETLLREVNSPHFALPHRVKDVSHAISLLGFKRTQEVVMQNTKHEMYEGVENSYFELMSFKRHGIAVGCFAEQIAKHLRLREPKEFFKAGSLHDIGKFFYLTRAPAQFEELIKKAKKENVPLFQLERKTFKTDHAELGALMAHQWKLPEPICAAIKYHHSIDSKIRDRLTTIELQMVDVTSYANLLAHGQKDAGASTGRRVKITDLPPPPGITDDEDLAKIIIAAENQFREECELAGITA